MKLKDGLRNCGMTEWIYSRIIGLSEAKTIALVGVSNKRELYNLLKDDYDVTMYDYNMEYNDTVCKDVVFDIELKEDLIVNFACEKMYPLGDIYKSREFILIGDSEFHNGDCNPIESTQQLIEQNHIKDVYDTTTFTRWRGKYYLVYGCN
jgi:hypothetical protein